jgi:3-deoxy-manno-octulosonate cytidylyltransferase (CMP-KDO synthetase)
MNILGVIPARYASSRFPGKPLADIGGKSMVQRVYEQALKAGSLRWVLIATDDQKIFDHVRDFGGMVMMTNKDHSNGTSRVLEILKTLEKENERIEIDAVVNIQGDEPFIKPEQIDLLVSSFFDEDTEIATLCKKIDSREELFDPNTVKVVRDKRDFALYFSRSPIPFGRDKEKDGWLKDASYFKHLGIYGYRNNVLKEIVSLPASPLEIIEKLEQLRWLENGYRIKVLETEFESLSVDTPEDLKRILKSL